MKKNQDKVLKFYKKIGKDKKFIFWPDIDLFSKWIQQFPTFFIKRKEDKKIIGVFSITSLYCRMGEMGGKLCVPLLFNCCQNFKKETMKSLICVAKERDFDTLYLYQTGDIDNECLKSVNAIETNQKSWFSLYNNGISLETTDISIPLI